MFVCVFNVRCAAEVTDGSQYFVLLMITDGVISDMAQTKESVVNVSTAVKLDLLVIIKFCCTTMYYPVREAKSSLQRKAEKATDLCKAKIYAYR